MTYLEEFGAAALREGEAAVCWLGQAGFLLRDARGVTVAIDPYLTNFGEAMRGFKRLSPMAISPEELRPDYYVVTHTHFDHFDYEAIPAVYARSPGTVFLGPESCRQEMIRLIGSDERFRLLDRSMEFSADGLHFRAVEADHGTMAPDAIGLLLDIGGVRLYFSGDTAFREEVLLSVRESGPDAAFLSVNGRFGNLDAEEGALAARLLRVGTAVPCHCWTFAEHGGDPGIFMEMLKNEGDCTPFAFRYGETAVFRRKDGQRQ